MSDQDDPGPGGDADDPAPATGQDFEFLLESRLTGFAVYLTDFGETADGYDITYESIATDDTGTIPHREVGRILNVFRDIEDEPVEIQATVTDLDGTPMGEWQAEREWLDALEDGELTEVEFSERVIESIEAVSPDTD